MADLTKPGTIDITMVADPEGSNVPKSFRLAPGRKGSQVAEVLRSMADFAAKHGDKTVEMNVKEFKQRGYHAPTQSENEKR